MTIFKALGTKEKNSAFCMNWEIKCIRESGRTVTFLMGSVVDQGTKSLKHLQYLA